MGTGHDQSRKCGRKEAQPKKPGPQPEHPQKERKLTAKQARAGGQKHRRNREFCAAEKTRVKGLQDTVANHSGRPRTYHENCVFLCMFCALFGCALDAAALQQVCEPPDAHTVARAEAKKARMQPQYAPDLVDNFLTEAHPNSAQNMHRHTQFPG